MRYLLILLSILPSITFACSQRNFPDLKNLQGYSSIYKGIVKRVKIIPQDTHFSGYSERHDITIVVRKSYRGLGIDEITVKELYDCALPIPKKGDVGLFF